MNQYALDPQKRDRDVHALIEEAQKHTREQIRPGDVEPGGLAPVLLQLNGRNTARLMRWGFPNHWGEGEVYAARAETIDERSTFHKSVQERRCIIPTTGFYDKKRSGEGAGRYIFHLQNTNELYMAGIYNQFKNDDNGGREEFYFAMLTTPSSASFEEYNERMPVVLRKVEWNKWLRGEYESLYDRSGLVLRGDEAPE